MTPLPSNFYDLLYIKYNHSLFRLKAEEERIRKEEDKARREFIKQEYLRRKQLKLMEDMDTIIKPRPAGGAKQRRSRPKSIHRDSLDSPKTPVRAATGNQGDNPHQRGQSCPICQSSGLPTLCCVPLQNVLLFKSLLF